LHPSAQRRVWVALLCWALLWSSSWHALHAVAHGHHGQDEHAARVAAYFAQGGCDDGHDHDHAHDHASETVHSHDIDATSFWDALFGHAASSSDCADWQLASDGSALTSDRQTLLGEPAAARGASLIVHAPTQRRWTQQPARAPPRA
jgi:hypothetical protein